MTVEAMFFLVTATGVSSTDGTWRTPSLIFCSPARSRSGP